MPTLSPDAAQSRLAQLPGWQIESGELVRTFEFPDFVAALAFVNKVGELAEKAGHHPDIDIRYNRVRLSLVTHSAGGLTGERLRPRDSGPEPGALEASLRVCSTERNAAQSTLSYEWKDFSPKQTCVLGACTAAQRGQ